MATTQDDLIPFASESIARVLSFSIHEEEIGDHLILRLRCDEQNFLFMQRLITQKAPSAVSSHPDELIDYIVRSMPKWYGVKETSPFEGWAADLKRLTLLLDKSFALHLPSYKAHAFEEDGAGNIVLDRREIE